VSHPIPRSDGTCHHGNHTATCAFCDAELLINALESHLRLLRACLAPKRVCHVSAAPIKERSVRGRFYSAEASVEDERWEMIERMCQGGVPTTGQQ
jgi:hypothetical protein